MKKTLWIAMTVALAASVIAVSAQEVLSANAVGYIKKTLPANSALIALSVPLNSMAATNIIFGDTSVADEAPVGSEAFFWNPTEQKWVGGGKGSKGWGPLALLEIVPGEAFFMKGLAGDVDREVTITGEVPEVEQLSRAIPGSGGLGTVGNPFPVDFVFGTSSLASNATVGSEAFFWDVGGQKWIGGGKGSKGWGPLATQVVFAAEGFFLREAGSVNTWDETKPYTWP